MPCGWGAAVGGIWESFSRLCVCLWCRYMLRGLLVRLGDFGGCLGPIITEISQIQCRASDVGASEHPRRHARLRRAYLSGYLELQNALEIHESPLGDLVI